MEERFRPLTFHGLILRSQLVTLLVRGVCYSENQSVSTPSRELEHRHPCCLDSKEVGTMLMGCLKKITLGNASVF